MTNNSERIRALAPGNAAYFRLKMHLSDGNVRIFPPDDGTYYYFTLGISPRAAADEIKSAYRCCAREAHPDRCGDAEKVQALQAAYALLSDPDKRARYDAERRAWMAQIGAVECMRCGHPNRITRRVPSGHLARCWHCKTPLAVRPEQALQAKRRAFAREVAHVVDTVGGELAELAVDGVRLGLGRLRRFLGLGPGARGTT